jgi:hypothetical protein
LGLTWTTVYLSVLGLRIASPAVCEGCLRALATLATNSVARNKLHASNMHLRVIRAMHIHSKMIATVVWGIVCLRMMYQDDKDHIPRFLGASGAEAVFACLRKYNRNNTIVEHCCRVIYNVCKENEEVRSKRVMYGIISHVELLTCLVFAVLTG